MNKCFCRRPDFVQADLGNHYLVTNWTASTVPTLDFSGYNVLSLCGKDGVNQWFEVRTILLGAVAFATLEFADWFLHYLRGASMHGYTRFNASTPVSACPDLARHYCEQWIEFERYDFNVDALRPIYQKLFCSGDDKLWPMKYSSHLAWMRDRALCNLSQLLFDNSNRVAEMRGRGHWEYRRWPLVHASNRRHGACD
jgi:hypothetical protein